MQVSKIYFQKNYPVADFQYEHFGVEIMIEGGNVDEAFNEAREITRQQWLKVAHQFEDSIHVIEPPVIKEEKEPEPEISMEQAINSFTEIKGANGLESFKILVKGKPELQKIYDQKLKALSK
jgi:hypothetical protein